MHGFSGFPFYRIVPDGVMQKLSTALVSSISKGQAIRRKLMERTQV